MNRMNNHHRDVELEKSSSGTWAASMSARHDLKPWQRLWIVIGLIYMMLIAGSCYLLMPDQDSVERRMVFAVTEEVRRYDGMAFAGESPRKVFEAARSMGVSSWIVSIRTKYRIGREGDAGFARIEKNYRDELSRLPAKRALGVIISIAAWLVPMSVLYLFGFVIDWIKRGGRSVIIKP